MLAADGVKGTMMDRSFTGFAQEAVGAGMAPKAVFARISVAGATTTTTKAKTAG
jgi:hypothetical protein